MLAEGGDSEGGDDGGGGSAAGEGGGAGGGGGGGWCLRITRSSAEPVAGGPAEPPPADGLPEEGPCGVGEPPPAASPGGVPPPESPLPAAFPDPPSAGPAAPVVPPTAREPAPWLEVEADGGGGVAVVEAEGAGAADPRSSRLTGDGAGVTGLATLAVRLAFICNRIPNIVPPKNSNPAMAATRIPKTMSDFLSKRKAYIGWAGERRRKNRGPGARGARPARDPADRYR